MKVSRVEEMRNLDQKAIELGIPPEILMENAGEAAYFVIHSEFGIRGKKFVFFCGPGNNGGDGCVVARKLYSNAGIVKVFLLTERDKFKGHARKNLDILFNIGIEIEYIDNAAPAYEDVNNSDAIIDAIFGTGLTRKVEGVYKEVIDLINSSGKKVFAIDIPSGVSGDSGQEKGVAVKADYTITYGLPKTGNLLYPGYDRCGNLYVSHISFPRYIYEGDKIKFEINPPAKLPDKNPDGSDVRKALFIALSRENYEVYYSSALSYSKISGGESYIACPQSVVQLLEGNNGVVIRAIKEKDELLKLAESVDIILVSKDFSYTGEAAAAVLSLLEQTAKPVLFENGAIAGTLKSVESIKVRKGDTVIVIGLEEMASISETDIEDLECNKMDTLQRLSKDLNSIIVLGGNPTIIGFPDGRVFIDPYRNAGKPVSEKSVGLSNIIVTLFGLGLNIEDSIRTAVYLHKLILELMSKEANINDIAPEDFIKLISMGIQHYGTNYESIYNKTSSIISIV